jgi:hypothetical protein
MGTWDRVRKLTGLVLEGVLLLSLQIVGDHRRVASREEGMMNWGCILCDILVRDDGVYKRGKLFGLLDGGGDLVYILLEDERVDRCVLEGRAAIQVESDNSK